MSADSAETFVRRKGTYSGNPFLVQWSPQSCNPTRGVCRRRIPTGGETRSDTKKDRLRVTGGGLDIRDKSGQFLPVARDANPVILAEGVACLGHIRIVNAVSAHDRQASADAELTVVDASAHRCPVVLSELI